MKKNTSRRLAAILSIVIVTLGLARARAYPSQVEKPGVKPVVSLAPISSLSAPQLPTALPILPALPASALPSASEAAVAKSVSIMPAAAASAAALPVAVPSAQANEESVLLAPSQQSGGAVGERAAQSALFDGSRSVRYGSEISDSLQPEVSAQAAALKAWGRGQERTLVVVQSMSLDPDLLKGVSGIDKYETRSLAMLLKARDPGLRMIFVTSKPVPQYVIDHVFRSAPDREEILSRVEFVSLSDDPNAESLQAALAEKMLRPENSGALEKIKSLIAQSGRPAALLPFISSRNELEIANRLGIPLYAPHPDLLYWGTKSGSRRIFREVGLLQTQGYEDLKSQAEVEDAIDRLWTANRGLMRVMIKVNDGVSGLGNKSARLPAWTDDQALRLSAIHEAVERAKQGPIGADVLAMISKKGGVVEEFIEEAAGSPSPSGQGKILSNGAMRIVSSHEQRLSETGVYLGATYPANEPYRDQIIAMTRKIGEALARKGGFGRFSVDFLALPNGRGGYRVLPVEINFRSGGTTHPFLAAGLLPKGARLLEDGRLQLPDGRFVFYNASDHTLIPGLTGMPARRFLDFFRDKGVRFDKRTCAGVLFHLTDAVTSQGNVGYTVVATSREQANAIEARLLKLLRQLESEYVGFGNQASRSVTVKKAAAEDRPTVAILGETAESMLMLRAGKEQALGDVHVVRDSSWLSRVKQADGTVRMYLKKGLTFNAAGELTLVTYKVPRRVRFFAGTGKKAASLAKGLDAPTSVRTADASLPDGAEKHVAEMLDRARLNALRGKSLVVVGFAVGAHHRQYLEYAKQLGVKVQLIHLRESKEALDVFEQYNPTDLVETVISVDVPLIKDEPALERENRIARLAFAAAEKAGIKKDGIGSFVEEDVIIAALLAQKWGLPHMPPQAVRRLRDKEMLRELRQAHGLPTAASAKIGTEAELEAAIDTIGFPAVLKPDTGSHAQGVVRINNASEARAKFRDVMGMIARDPLKDGDLSVGQSVLYMKLLQGKEVDIDFVLRRGEMIYGSVTDNHPTLPGSFAPTGITSPSVLPEEAQERMLADAVKTALSAGARDGVFHFEGYLTDKGPFVLFDANPRVGGRPVVPLNNDIWGVNLLKESFLLWAGIPGQPYVPTFPGIKGPAGLKPNFHVYAKVMHAPRSGVFRGVKGWEKLIEDPRVYLPATMYLNKPGSRLSATPILMDRVYVLSAKGKTAQEAQANAEALAREYDLQAVIED